MFRHRRWMCRLAVLACIATAVVLGVAVYQLQGVYRAIAANACGIDVQRVVPAPNGRVALVTFEVSCGATTPFSTQATILPAGARFSRDDFPAFFVVHGRHDLASRWIGDGQVEIIMPRNHRVYRRDASAGGIAVLYR